VESAVKAVRGERGERDRGGHGFSKVLYQLSKET
jgi:hypothetical protein